MRLALAALSAAAVACGSAGPTGAPFESYTVGGGLENLEPLPGGILIVTYRLRVADAGEGVEGAHLFLAVNAGTISPGAAVSGDSGYVDGVEWTILPDDEPPAAQQLSLLACAQNRANPPCGPKVITTIN